MELTSAFALLLCFAGVSEDVSSTFEVVGLPLELKVAVAAGGLCTWLPPFGGMCCNSAASHDADDAGVVTAGASKPGDVGRVWRRRAAKAASHMPASPAANG